MDGSDFTNEGDSTLQDLNLLYVPTPYILVLLILCH